MKSYLLKFGLISLGLLLMLTPKKNNQLPRGIRNHNPGNIRYHEHNQWQGQVGYDNARFSIFSSAHYGLRALAKLLTNYKQNYGLQSVYGIIKKYAPHTENDTNSYIQFVSQKMGIDEHQALYFERDLPVLMKWIVYFENGQQPYTRAQFIEAIKAI